LAIYPVDRKYFWYNTTMSKRKETEELFFVQKLVNKLK